MMLVGKIVFVTTISGAQTPLLHWPEAQTRPHAPQLFTSASVLLHAPPIRHVSGLHSDLHMPATQAGIAFGSVVVHTAQRKPQALGLMLLHPIGLLHPFCAVESHSWPAAQ